MKTIIDVETRSECDLKTSGPWVYSEHPSTEVTCMAIKEGKGRTYIWINDYAKQICMDHFPGDLPMISFSEAIVLLNRAELIEAHNVFFEKSIYENVLFDWPEIPDHKWRCSAAKAASFNLPRGLDDACQALGLAQRKDKFGYFVMMKLCKPRKPTKHNPDKWHESPEDLLTLFNYCIQDVEAEYALSQTLSDLSSRELAIWSIDQKINKRGLYVDLEGAKAAIKLIEKHEKKLLEEFIGITYHVHSPKQVARTIKWLAMRGTKLKDLKKETVAKQLEKKLPKDVRRVLEIRKSLAKSSTAKFRQMASGASSDNRMRDTTMYYGAGTGRWAGKRVQPHNMPRKMPDGYEEIIALTKLGDLETLELLYGDPMQALSGSVRAFICAAPGHDLICGDYASIEGRVLAWLAEEEYVLKNYFDKKDAYCVLASQIHGVPYDKILNGYKNGIKKYDQMRFLGKTGELACGYQGGEKAVKQFAPDMNKPGRQAIVDLWRANRPMTVTFWHKMEAYAKAAIHTGKIYTWNNIKWGLNGKGFLLCKLPSGRYLSYYRPYIVKKLMPWGREKEVISFMGVDTDTKRWCRQYTYGGKLVENIVQAVARDFLAEALVRLEKENYPVVLHVHDEAVSEVVEGTGKVKQFTDLMAQVPEWATGCPIEVDGFRTKRYRK